MYRPRRSTPAAGGPRNRSVTGPGGRGARTSVGRQPSSFTAAHRAGQRVVHPSLKLFRFFHSCVKGRPRSRVTYARPRARWRSRSEPPPHRSLLRRSVPRVDADARLRHPAICSTHPRGNAGQDLCLLGLKGLGTTGSRYLNFQANQPRAFSRCPNRQAQATWSAGSCLRGRGPSRCPSRARSDPGDAPWSWWIP